MSFAVATAMAEAVLLSLITPAALPLAPQISALPPLAAFHDLRWLYAAEVPWPVFLLLLAALIVARAAITATTARLAWPRGSPRPSALAGAAGALALTVLLYVLMSPVASLSFGVAILPFSWPYLASVPVMLGIAATVSHGGLTAGWWRSLPPPAAVGWLLADFVALTVAAALIARAPTTAAVPLAGAAGLVNARAWHGVAHAVVRAQRAQARRAVVRARPARPVPRALLATVAVLALSVALTRLAFLITTPSPSPAQAHPTSRAAAGGVRPGPPARPGADPPARTARRPVVLVVPGFGSVCCSRATSLARVMPGALVRQFSYRGLSPAGRPLAYGPAASNLPLPVLGDRIAAQVQRLHGETGRPVDVVAESEGTLGVKAMLARHPGVPVGSLALLSPIVAPGGAGDRGLGEQDLLPDAQLRAVIWFVGGLSPFGTSGAQTLIESVGQTGARYAAAARARPRRILAIVPLADAVALPACPLPANVRVVAAIHGVLLGVRPALRMVRAFFNARPVPGGTRLRGPAELVAAAASAWRMPRTAPQPAFCGP